MTSEIGIVLVCLIGSFATFFSGFGLGTVLLPVFSLYFPLELAVLATALVHFSNNLFKLTIMSRHIDLGLFKKFGITALIGAFLGAYLLNVVGRMGILYVFPFWGGREVTLLSFAIGLLMLFFVLFEWKKIQFPFSKAKLFLPIGGFLSGFFGGFSGHQGALRSAFLSKLSLDKQLFVATSALISTLIDFSRISMYTSQTNWKELNLSYLFLGAFSAFVGSVLGKKYLTKVSFRFIQVAVAVFLLAMSLGLITGLL